MYGIVRSTNQCINDKHHILEITNTWLIRILDGNMLAITISEVLIMTIVIARLVIICPNISSIQGIVKNWVLCLGVEVWTFFLRFSQDIEGLGLSLTVLECRMMELRRGAVVGPVEAPVKAPKSDVKDVLWTLLW